MSLHRALTAVAAAFLSFAAPVYAHPGHGATEAMHWHASDTSGFLMVALLAGLAIWLARGED
jgi:uncharacterized membrane protein